MLGDLHEPRGFVDVAAAKPEMLVHRVARQGLDPARAGVIAERADLIGVETLGDELAFGLGDHFMEAIIGVAD